MFCRGLAECWKVRGEAMKFGEYLKQKREERHWTQPEAATKAGIEQSYLSKLETGRSYPSEEVFSRLSQAYALDVVEMAQQIDGPEVERLRDVSQLRLAVLSHQLASHQQSRRWMIAGVVACALGGTGLGLAMTGADREMTQYSYRSMGVLEDGESLIAMEFVGGGVSGTPGPSLDAMRARHLALEARVDEAYHVTGQNRGDAFVETLPEGRRYFLRLGEEPIIVRSQLRWFRVPGLMLLFGGIACLVAGFRRR